MRRQRRVLRRRDDLFGRDGELAALRELLVEGAPLITITGPAGVGKTAVAVRLASDLRAWTRQEGIGVHVCDLAEARDRAAVCAAIASSLGVSLTQAKDDASFVDSVGHALGTKPGILFLDNFDQVVGEAAHTLSVWLARAPEVSFVVTSRERLRLAEETVYELGNLALPELGNEQRSSPAVELWVARVRSVQPEYRLSPRESVVVSHLLHELEGLPLAIELAAARCNIMDAATLLDRMKTRLEVLAHGRRDAHDRHESLRKALDASWDLLTNRERATLAQCSLFVGPFSVEAAEAVVDLSGLPGGESALDAIQSLRDKSLVRVVAENGGVARRLVLYLAIRDYGRERLSDFTVSARAALLERHSTYFVALGRRLGAESHGTGGGEALRRLALERNHLLAVAERSLEGPDPPPSALDRALEICWALESLVRSRDPVPRQLALLNRALGAPQAGATNPVLRARALVSRGRSTMSVVDASVAKRDFDAAVSISRDQGDPGLEALALRFLCVVLARLGRLEEAETAGRRALELARAGGDAALQGWVHYSLGLLAQEQERRGLARDDYQEAVDCFRRGANHAGELIALSALSIAYTDAGDLDQARSCTEAAAPAITALGPATCQEKLQFSQARAYYEHAADRLEDARRHYEEALTTARALGDAHAQCMVAVYAAIVRFEQGRLQEAGVELRDALPGLRRLDPHYECLARAMLGAVEAELDRRPDARALIEAAEDRLRETKALGPLVVAVQTCRGMLELAESRDSAARGDTALADRLRTTATRRMGDARLAAGGPFASGSFELTIARRLLGRALERPAKTVLPADARARAVRSESDVQRPELELAMGTRCLTLPDGARVTYGRRPVMRRMLVALARARLESPGTPVSWARLVEAAWPGDRSFADAARNRLRVMINRMREMGLRPWLHGNDEGYLLDPALPVRFEEREVMSM